MTVQSYVFQSPSPQQVQVGRPDTSTAKEETKSESDTKTKDETPEVQATGNVENEKPEGLTLDSANQILDLYV